MTNKKSGTKDKMKLDPAFEEVTLDTPFKVKVLYAGTISIIAIMACILALKFLSAVLESEPPKVIAAAVAEPVVVSNSDIPLKDILVSNPSIKMPDDVGEEVEFGLNGEVYIVRKKGSLEEKLIAEEKAAQKLLVESFVPYLTKICGKLESSQDAITTSSVEAGIFATFADYYVITPEEVCYYLKEFENFEAK